jgi:hypothetical protein
MTKPPTLSADGPAPAVMPAHEAAPPDAWLIERCPWLANKGPAGSREYAEANCEFFAAEFGGTWEVRQDNGWNWAEQITPQFSSAEEPQARAGQSAQNNKTSN